MAFQYWRQCPRPRPEKTCFLALGDAYHGDTLGGVSVGGVERFHAMFRPLLFETLRLPAPDSYRRPPGVTPEELAAHHLAKLDRMLAEQHGRIAWVGHAPDVGQHAAAMCGGWATAAGHCGTRYATPSTASSAWPRCSRTSGRI